MLINLKFKRNAFSLVELVITLAISAILFGALMAVLYAVQKSANSYYKFVKDDRVINITNYIFRDFSGAFVPQYNPEYNPEYNPDDKNNKTLIKDCFECSSDSNGSLQEIKFITNNCLPVYQANPIRLNRVIYKLDKSDDLFKILRSKDMSIEAKTEPSFYI